MDAALLSRVEGTARAAARDQVDVQESRLWDRARLNLMLLYGGRRVGNNNTQGSASLGATSPFGAVDLDI